MQISHTRLLNLVIGSQAVERREIETRIRKESFFINRDSIGNAKFL